MASRRDVGAWKGRGGEGIEDDPSGQRVDKYKSAKRICWEVLKGAFMQDMRDWRESGFISLSRAKKLEKGRGRMAACTALQISQARHATRCES